MEERWQGETKIQCRRERVKERKEDQREGEVTLIIFISPQARGGAS